MDRPQSSEVSKDHVKPLMRDRGVRLSVAGHQSLPQHYFIAQTAFVSLAKQLLSAGFNMR
jgi:hypothetical protein